MLKIIQTQASDLKKSPKKLGWLRGTKNVYIYVCVHKQYPNGLPASQV